MASFFVSDFVWFELEMDLNETPTSDPVNEIELHVCMDGRAKFCCCHGFSIFQRSRVK
jgi:hypothetical protein